MIESMIISFILGYFLFREMVERPKSYSYKMAMYDDDELEQLKCDMLNQEEEWKLMKRVHKYEDDVLQDKMKCWNMHAQQVDKAINKAPSITLTAEQQLEYLPEYQQYLIELKEKNRGNEWPDTRIEMDFAPWLYTKLHMPYTGFVDHFVSFRIKPQLRIKHVTSKSLA